MGFKMRFYLCILFLSVSFSSFGQLENSTPNKKQHLSVSFNYGYGNIMHTNEFVQGDNLKGQPLNYYEFYSWKVLFQNPGYVNWQKIYRGPYYGMGFTMSNFFNSREIGRPKSVYGILGLPILRGKKLELYSEFQYGLAWGWKYYDPLTNPKNVVNGGGITAHLNIGLNSFYPLTKKLDMGIGLNFVHFSNGAMERPNRGFNIYTPSVEFKYHLSGRPNTRSIGPSENRAKTHDLFLMLGYGNQQLAQNDFDSNYYAVAGLSAIYFNQLTKTFRLGFGTDINYWWGLSALPNGGSRGQDLKNLTAGFIIQPEVIIDRLTFVGVVGIYAGHLRFGSFNQLYQRLGVRYDFYKNWSIGVNIRAIEFYRAEFMEFNLGYRFRWRKKR